MIDDNKLDSAIKSNLSKIGKIFADEQFQHESLSEIKKVYFYYKEKIIIEPGGDRNTLVPFNKFNCVYFLMTGDYVSYIGQTSHLCERLATHVNSGKDFTHVHWECVSIEDMRIMESFNISYHNPELNKEKHNMNELVLMLARKIS